MAIGEVAMGTVVGIDPEFETRMWSDRTITMDTKLTITGRLEFDGETYPTYSFKESEIKLNGLFLELR